MSTISLYLLSGLLASAPSVSVEEVRATTRSMLESMCGQQCDVVDVKVKKRPARPQGGAVPGFDDAPRARLEPSEIQLALLFDSKLNGNYRKFVADRVRDRIREYGLPVTISPRVRSFPKAPVLDTPQPQTPQPPPQPIIIQPPQQPQPQPNAVEAVPAPNWVDLLFQRFIELLPLLLLFLLLAWLVLRVLKRLENLAFDLRVPAEEPVPTITADVVEERPTGAQPLPPPSIEDLRGDLGQYRSSTRRVFRRLLSQGDHDTVARSVALLGDFVVQDLANDPAIHRALLAAGQRTAEVLRAPMTDEEQEETLRTVQAELVADRVAHRAEDVQPGFEALLGFSPEAFAALVAGLQPRLRLVALRHAPGHLCETYLKGKSDSSRAKIVRELLDTPASTPEEISALAAIIEVQGQAALVGGYETERIVGLLDALPAASQEDMVTTLEQTRPDFLRRNLGQLPVESALLKVPEQGLQGAWAQVSVEDWVAYLRGAPENIRVRALASCPQRLRDSIEDELSLRVSPDPQQVIIARRRIVSAALEQSAAYSGSKSTPSRPKDT